MKMLRKPQTPMIIQPVAAEESLLKKTENKKSEEMRQKTIPPIMQTETLNYFLPRSPRKSPDKINAIPMKI
jgi:hypothetical protein